MGLLLASWNRRRRHDRVGDNRYQGNIRVLTRACVNLASWLVLVLVVDVALYGLGVFPPRYPRGDAELGIWLKRTGDACSVYSSVLPELKDDPDVGRYCRNEAGFASSCTMQEYLAPSQGLRIISIGDSHTDLYYDFARTHMGVLEAALVEAGHVDAKVLGAGHGFYSILQSWLLYQTKLGDLNPDVLILNFYSGNDLYDLIRQDDRPYMVPVGMDAYVIHPPRWVAYVPDSDRPLWSHSRLIYAMNCGLRLLGLDHLSAKTRAAWTSARMYGGDPLSSLRYLNDLRNSRDPELWYPGAASAQALNQALFFHHFPGSSDESLLRVRFILTEMRKADPGCILVLSMIPSRYLASGARPDFALDRVLERLPLSRTEVVRQEEELYRRVMLIGEESGWLVVDPLTQFLGAGEGCYFASDWHIAPGGSHIVGRAQADVVLTALRAHWTGVSDSSSRIRQ